LEHLRLPFVETPLWDLNGSTRKISWKRALLSNHTISARPQGVFLIDSPSVPCVDQLRTSPSPHNLGQDTQIYEKSLHHEALAASVHSMYLCPPAPCVYTPSSALAARARAIIFPSGMFECGLGASFICAFFSAAAPISLSCLCRSFRLVDDVPSSCLCRSSALRPLKMGSARSPSFSHLSFLHAARPLSFCLLWPCCSSLSESALPAERKMTV